MLNIAKKRMVVALLMGSALATPAIAKTLQSESAISATEPLATMQAEHIMLTTADYNETLIWYQEKLDFRIKHEWTVPEFPGLQLAYLEKNGFIVEVVASPDTPTMPATETFSERLVQPGIGHFAFLVADVDAAIADLEARDVQIVLPPTSFPDSGRRVAFFEDNNGNLIEFLEELPLGERQPYTGGES
ncbi:MAG: VOC family protein [Kaiparowitsia implicata GSE-PSE-MK54-09C]|jgi:catechol 2,3-dioxygenase-like lactoylglutathione lyase family enzyme|nr:VOC family protein [Kaiparowitsia implicata GSE-PSE-MK54-09C]